MKKYVTIYPFQVIGEIKEGKSIYCIDREQRDVLPISVMSVNTLFTILKDSEKTENYGKYEFYYIEEGEAEYEIS